MLLSIIVVSWNVREYTRACLQSVRREMKLPAADCELIVVDNASADGSAAMVRDEFPDVRLVESPVNLGFGAACNVAYGLAGGEFVLLLNPDTEVLDHALDGLLAVMQARPDVGIVAPRLVNADRSFQQAAGGALPTLANVAWHYLFLRDLLPRRIAPPALFLQGDPQGELSVGWVSGAAMLVRRSAAGERLFDESFFMFGEDMDICDRIRGGGWDVVYTSRHSILHHHGRSFARQDSLEIRASAHDGPRRLFAKHHGAASVAAYDAIMLAGFLARWPLFRILSLLRPGRGCEERAEFARRYVRAMLHGLRRRAGDRPGRG